MPRGNKKIYYWDTCCFIAWITGKCFSDEVLDGLREIAKEITENRAILCTSVTTETEILEGKLTAEEMVKFENLFKRRNVIQITLDHRISKLASEIRSFYDKRGIKIKTPDAQHLATAIIYGADEFHTMDGGGQRARPSDLLRLNGDVAGRPLHIRMPRMMPPPLFRNAEQGAAIEQSNQAEIESSAVEVQGSSSGHTGSETTEEKKEGASEG